VTVKVIKHSMFSYAIPKTDEDGEPIIRQTKHGVDRPAVRRAHASRFDEVDIPLDEDVERGEAMGAFFTDEEVAAMKGESPAAAANGLNFDDPDALVRWIKEDKPNAGEVVNAADDDPDKAMALLDAEEEATGGQPRKTVSDGLQKIIDKPTE